MQKLFEEIYDVFKDTFLFLLKVILLFLNGFAVNLSTRISSPLLFIESMLILLTILVMWFFEKKYPNDKKTNSFSKIVLAVMLVFTFIVCYQHWHLLKLGLSCMLIAPQMGDLCR